MKRKRKELFVFNKRKGHHIKWKSAKFNYDIESTGGEWITSKRVNIYLCLNCNEYLFFGEDRIVYMYGYIDNINPLLNCNEMIIKKIIE